MTMEAELADGRVLEFPDGTNPAVIQATVKKMLAGSIPDDKQVEKNSPLTNAALAEPSVRMLLGASSLLTAPFQLGANVGDKIATAMGNEPIVGKWVNEKLSALEKAKQEAMAERSGNKVGEDWDVAGFLGSMIPGAGAYKAFAGALPKVLSEQSGSAIGRNAGRMLSGGVSTAATVPVASDNGYWGEKGVTTGIGAVAPVALQPVISGTAKLAGSAIDLVKGDIAKLKARNILRDAAGKEISQIKAALANSGDELSASQAAADVGSTKWSALGERATKNESQYFYDLAQRQEQARLDKVAAVAGGYTQTGAKQATQGTKDSLNMVTTPMRETELNAANTAGDVERKLQPLVEQRHNSMVDALQEGMQGNRTFPGGTLPTTVHAGTESAQSLNRANNWSPVPGYPQISGRYSPNMERSAEFASASADFAAIKAQRQAERDFFQNQIDSLAAHGLKPLDSTTVSGKITALANDPKFAGNKTAQSALSFAAKEVEEWTAKNGGIIDAYALDSIRKNAVNEAINSIMGAADPKVKAKASAELLSAIKPSIIDAIESAGGTGYRAYLNTFEEGMKVINRQKLGAKALEMLQNSPDDFLKLVNGNNPKAVQKIFASEFDFSKAMAEKNKPMQEVASELGRDAKLKDLADAGREELANILKNDATKFRLPNFLSRPVYLVNKGLDIAEGSLNKKVMAQVYNAMKNGNDANALMEKLSASERNAVLKALVNGDLRPYLSNATANATKRSQQ